MTIKTVVEDIIQRTHNVKSLRFSRPSSFDYKAGQYLIILLPNRKGGVLKKPLTISSSPTEDFIEITKKITGGHEFSEAIDSVEVGDEIQLNAPYGEFVLDKTQTKVAMLSGGIGITPFRSMCRYATDLPLETDIVLFYGNKTSQNIVFKEEFDQMQKENQNFRIVNTLTRQEPNWKGHTGHIDVEMIKNELPDYSQRLFYLCGPPGMMNVLQSLLVKLDVFKEKIMVEKFPTK